MLWSPLFARPASAGAGWRLPISTGPTSSSALIFPRRYCRRSHWGLPPNLRRSRSKPNLISRRNRAGACGAESRSANHHDQNQDRASRRTSARRRPRQAGAAPRKFARKFAPQPARCRSFRHDESRSGRADPAASATGSARLFERSGYRFASRKRVKTRICSVGSGPAEPNKLETGGSLRKMRQEHFNCRLHMLPHLDVTQRDSAAGRSGNADDDARSPRPETVSPHDEGPGIEAARAAWLNANRP